ncbi:unnamed protein product [Chrysoparadoxa australica]
MGDVTGADNEEWVELDFKLLNWRYMNFTERVRTSTLLFTIRKLLMHRHGLIRDLVICKGSFTEANEMVNEMKSLKDYGIRGACKDVDPPRVSIFYDFKPYNHDEPLLLCGFATPSVSCPAER